MTSLLSDPQTTNMLNLFGWLIALGVVLFSLGPVLVLFLRKHGPVDVPSARSVHHKPTPRAGGLIFIVPFLLIVPIWLYGSEHMAMPLRPFFWVCLLMALPVSIISLVDDYRGVHPFVRLFMQLVIVSICVVFLPPLLPKFGVTGHIIAEKFMLTLLWVWFLNLYNFMDGSDGLAGTEGCFISLFFILNLPALLVPAAVLLVGLLAFLNINKPKAKVFMGDTGSTFLGFVLGGFILFGIYTWGIRGVWALVALTLFFLMDTGYTLISRILRGKKPWQSHDEHWYHRAYRAGCTHTGILKFTLLIDIILFALAWTILKARIYVLPLALGMTILICSALYIKSLEMREHNKNERGNA